MVYDANFWWTLKSIYALLGSIIISLLVLTVTGVLQMRLDERKS